MSRNMIEMNINLFNQLEMLLPQEISGMKLGASVKRYINTECNEKLWLQDCEINCTNCLPNIHVFTVKFEDRTLIVLPEDEIEQPFMRGIKKNENDNNNSGILTAIWGEFGYISESKDMGYELAQDIFGRDGGYKLIEISKYFMKYDIWEVDTDIYENNLISVFRIYGGGLISGENKLILGYSKETLCIIKTLMENTCGKIIGEVVFRGLTAIHWEHAFLEFYRCIERLYSIPNAILAKTFFESGKRIDEIENFFDRRWMFKEEEMLRTLLNEINETELFEKFIKVFGVEVDNKEDTEINNYCSIVSKNIYKIRNSIAHFRQTGNSLNKENLDWDKLIYLMCEVITKLYVKYNDLLV
ncbi:hypothetical protein [Clostridium estertheticum]|uniref:hypothetical protein n=1 Tax=Clostridium estertheticum TaxID=238834 RepID=UPI001CF59FC4|nr:hypothetical protein [Clostridium estertheticum]MCB2339959.1 hypothetical protein [Clostridium estertheticum]